MNGMENTTNNTNNNKKKSFGMTEMNTNIFARIFLFLFSVSLAIVLEYYLKKNSYKISLITVSLVLSLLLCMYFFFKPSQGLSFLSLLSTNFWLVIFILTIVFSVYYYKDLIEGLNYLLSWNSFTYNLSGYILDILLIVPIILLGLVLVYSQYRDYLQSQRGSIGYFFQVFFFIPCLVYDFILWVSGELKMTPFIIYFLLFIEAFLIALYMYTSEILKWLSIGNPFFRILSEPSFLNTEQKLMTAEQFGGLVKDNRGNVVVGTNFYTSFWVYLNDNMTSTQSQLPIFCYGGGEIIPSSDLENPYGQHNMHPAVVFIPKMQKTNKFGGEENNSIVGHLGIYFSNTKDPVVIDVPLQRWNFIAFNYTYPSVDLYVNGDFIRTEKFKEDELPIYNLSDTISIGGKKLQGAINYINYSNHNLSNKMIVSMYNMYMFTNKLVPAYLTV